jgi:hypothetical protein
MTGRTRRSCLLMMMMVSCMALPSAALATGTSTGGVRCDFPGGPIAGQPIACTMTLTNTTSTRHTYHLWGGFFERGALQDDCTGDLRIGPGSNASCTFFSGSFLLGGLHRAAAVAHFGLDDDNTAEGNLRLSITVLTAGSTSSQTSMAASY